MTINRTTKSKKKTYSTKYGFAFISNHMPVREKEREAIEKYTEQTESKVATLFDRMEAKWAYRMLHPNYRKCKQFVG